MPSLADEKRVKGLIQSMGVWVQARRGEGRGENPQRDFAIVGVRSRGDVIGQRVAEQLGFSSERIGVLDITLYRDDLSEISSQPVVRTTEINFSIDGLDVVLIDDVLMSGRSVRAAMSSLMDMGRPRRVWLAVLVDRGEAMRELPIAPDFAGMIYDGPGRVSVRLTPTDDRDAIELEGE